MYGWMVVYVCVEVYGCVYVYGWMFVSVCVYATCFVYYFSSRIYVFYFDLFLNRSGCRPSGGLPRRSQPAQALPGPGGVEVDWRHHWGGVPAAHREGRGPAQALPGESNVAVFMFDCGCFHVDCGCFRC